MLSRIACIAVIAAAVQARTAPVGDFLTLGAGEYVEISGPGAQVCGTPISVQAWLRSERPYGHVYACGFENGPESARQAGYALYLNFGGKARFGVNNSAAGFAYENWDNANTKLRVADGTWHHVTAVFPGNGRDRVCLYLDGRQVSDAELSRVGAAQPPLTEYIIGQAPARIGAPAWAAPRHVNCFEGDLDEIRVWDIALTAEQVAANYDKAVAPETPGLVSMWSFADAADEFRDAVSGATGSRRRLPVETVPDAAFDFADYPGGLTGWTGYDPNRIAHWTLKPAVRQRVGRRGLCQPALTQLADGSLLLAAAAGSGNAPLRFFRSRDRGRTWTETAPTGSIPAGRFPRFRQDFPGGLRLEALTAERRKRRWVSADAGHTWKTLPARQQPVPALPPASCARLSTGRYLAALTVTGAYPLAGRPLPWGSPQPPGDRSADHSILIDLRPNGFPNPGSGLRPFLNYSETGAHLLPLADGRLLATFHSRHVPFGTMAVFSADQGASWDFEHPVYLARAWGPGGGWPASVQFDDGSVLTAYGLQAYANEPADTVVEVVHWQPPPANGSVGGIPGIAASITFAGEAPDLNRYPAKLYGYSGGGRARQQVAYLRLAAAKRTVIGHRGLYKGALARLPDGTLIATPSYQRMVEVYRSTDNGETWELIAKPGLTGKEMGAAVLRDGTLLNLHGASIYRSTDAGVTWDAHYADGLRGYGLVRNVVEMDDGALLMVVGSGTYYKRDAPASTARRLISRDGGRTWPEIESVPSWDDPENMFDEAAMVRLPNGNLLAAGRVTDGHKPGGRDPALGWPSLDGSEYADHMILTESADNGRTWSEPRDFLDYSRPHAELLVLADGRLLACYANYFLPFGVAAMLSEDNGRTWNTNQPIYLAYSTECYTGWPTSVQLDDGSILTMVAVTAYAGRQDQTRAEVVRWQLPPRGR